MNKLLTKSNKIPSIKFELIRLIIAEGFMAIRNLKYGCKNIYCESAFLLKIVSITSKFGFKSVKFMCS